MYRRTNSAIDGEGLQADVMRFMAIIAFCLVAIMALVRDVSPPVRPSLAPEVVQVPVTETPEPEILPEIPKATTPKPVAKLRDVPVVQIAQAKPEVVEPELRRVFQVQPKRQVEPKPQVQPKLQAQLEPQEQPKPQTEPQPQPPAAQASADEPGLSLRFGTDKDFLRLIARGDMSVYLFDAQHTYRLSKSYAFSKAPAPGQIYELMPSTIPAAIKRSAQNSIANSEGYRWGVVMPARIASRIATLVQTERSGQLVINRFGEVRHQPNPALAGG